MTMQPGQSNSVMPYRCVECKGDPLADCGHLSGLERNPDFYRRGEAEAVERITHGRHCTCGACEREDWTNPALACCGMHGSPCPAAYQPLGRAGSEVSR